LDIVATRCEQPHWNALTAAWNNGWRPTTEQLEALPKPADTPSREVSSVSASEGVIGGESRRLSVASLNKNDRRSDNTCRGRRRIVS
jgi:hypothetical protein